MRVERDSIAGKDNASPREIAGTVREDEGWMRDIRIDKIDKDI